MNSIEYAELAGLKIALSNLMLSEDPESKSVTMWLTKRIAELSAKK